MPVGPTCLSQGTSPHLRGNRPRCRSGVMAPWDIPALTGEPSSSYRAARLRTGHPRTYGGTRLSVTKRPSRSGTSPHLRGNQRKPGDVPDNRRDIPALTGEPHGCPRCQRCVTGHPRTYGGTRIPRNSQTGPEGTSPHLRGNPYPAPTAVPSAHDIPALTGEPVSAPTPSIRRGGHPRTYGGTSQKRTYCSVRAGTSPHLRGNLAARTVGPGFGGDIPALTGEPRRLPTW